MEQNQPPPPGAGPYQVAAAGPFQHLLQQQNQQLQVFWNYQRQEMETAAEFKNQQLPLARIKKIMKADEDVRMISAEAPILFAKACELFILELTIRSWLHAEENKRRTLQKNDIAAAIARTDIFDFLVDIVPRDDLAAAAGAKDDDALGPGGGAAAPGVPYYYAPPPPALMMGQPADMYMHRQAWPHMWQPQEDGGEQGIDAQGFGSPPPPPPPPPGPK
ncbi:nuclear transcription factor Y subunit C-1-like [Zingiber officinale]|uniref:nuclear transcription factor Y subunit C-1-like n=1 Tax=Zingiber officinale TaxID=94328 RepID=UPI001C4B31BA|nr:nuclear transcription factor Y subunit C-1-like [Zingiber officinale]